jgi:16S rRNA U1498 N3-methylase RsmE
VREVLRVSVNDELCVGLVNGNIGMGRVTVLDDSVLEMDVRLEQAPPLPLPVTLILALPRPKVLRRVLRSAAALGVKRIMLLNCFRVEKVSGRARSLSRRRSANNWRWALSRPAIRSFPRSRCAGSSSLLWRTGCRG